MKFTTDSGLDDIADAGDHTTTERVLNIALPAGAIIVKVMVMAMIGIMNNTQTTHKIDITVQGRVAGGKWNTYWSEDACVGFPAVDAATTGLTPLFDITSLVTMAGDYGFRLIVNQSGGANSVRYTTGYLLLVTYQMG